MEVGIAEAHTAAAGSDTAEQGTVEQDTLVEPWTQVLQYHSATFEVELDLEPDSVLAVAVPPAQTVASEVALGVAVSIVRLAVDIVIASDSSTSVVWSVVCSVAGVAFEHKEFHIPTGLGILLAPDTDSYQNFGTAAES